MLLPSSVRDGIHDMTSFFFSSSCFNTSTKPSLIQFTKRKKRGKKKGGGKSRDSGRLFKKKSKCIFHVVTLSCDAAHTQLTLIRKIAQIRCKLHILIAQTYHLCNVSLASNKISINGLSKLYISGKIKGVDAQV